MRKIEIIPYNESWKKLYEIEKQLLRSILGDHLAEINHIGSTSIPNIMAKPIIDILIEAVDIEKIDALNQKFIEYGYEPKGENGIANRRYFQKGGDERTHHVHIFRVGHPEVRRHLAFRDYLIAHPDEARRYEDLKAKLAKQYVYDPQKYNEGKSKLVQELDQKAKKWYQ